jgi:OOP family OmpA-OmpF porin
MKATPQADMGDAENFSSSSIGKSPKIKSDFKLEELWVMCKKKRLLENSIAWGALPALLLGLAASVPAWAEGLYAGVSYGKSKISDGGACSTAGLVLNQGYNCSDDNEDNGWKIFGGYELNKYVAFEISYFDFGKFTANANGTGKNTSTSATASSVFEAKGWISFDVVGMLPLTKDFGLLGRVGTNRWRVENSASASDGTNSGQRDDTKPGFRFDSIGAGLRYGFNENMDVRLEWELFKDVGNTLLTGSGDIDLVTLGLVYKFK